MTYKFWTVPTNVCNDEPCYIIGGGASLREFDCSILKNRGYTIAVNTAGLTIAKWANILFWADHRWYEWNQGLIPKFAGLKLTRLRTDNPHFRNHYETIPYIEVIKFNPGIYLSDDLTTLGGYCSGSSALNIAYLMGANPIYLLGMDMKEDSRGRINFHEMHKLKTQIDRYQKRFLPVFNEMAIRLKNTETKVYTVSSNTALECFPVLTYKEFEEALNDPTCTE